MKLHSTEFLFAAFVLLLCAVSLGAGLLEERDALVFAGLAAGAFTAVGYAHSRGRAKAPPARVLGRGV